MMSDITPLNFFTMIQAIDPDITMDWEGKTKKVMVFTNKDGEFFRSHGDLQYIVNAIEKHYKNVTNA